MKYFLLGVSKHSSKKDFNIGVNIGDYVQALASSQFYPKIDGFLDRDVDLKDYHGDRAKMVMNGWYMHEPKNWPPSEMIDPLFVAFHLNSIAKDDLLSHESIEYLKKHQPIGCRDKKTVELLINNGVDAYFSGCMTLTLGFKYHSNEKDDKTYIVDPLYDGTLNLKNVFTAGIVLTWNFSDIATLIKEKNLNLHQGRNVVKKILKTALYYKEYVRVFGKSVVMNSEYICQDSIHYRDDFTSDENRLKEAERLIGKYAKARLVITSRIHCALPCLGMETPVLYIDKANDSETSSCRMDGLKQLFNTVTMENGKLRPSFHTRIPIPMEEYPINKESWRELAKGLITKCQNFMKSGYDENSLGKPC